MQWNGNQDIFVTQLANKKYWFASTTVYEDEFQGMGSSEQEALKSLREVLTDEVIRLQDVIRRLPE